MLLGYISLYRALTVDCGVVATVQVFKTTQ